MHSKSLVLKKHQLKKENNELEKTNIVSSMEGTPLGSTLETLKPISWSSRMSTGASDITHETPLVGFASSGNNDNSSSLLCYRIREAFESIWKLLTLAQISGFDPDKGTPLDNGFMFRDAAA